LKKVHLHFFNRVWNNVMTKLRKKKKKSFSKIREPAVLFLSSDVWKIESIIEEMKWKDEEIDI